MNDVLDFQAGKDTVSSVHLWRQKMHTAQFAVLYC